MLQGFHHVGNESLRMQVDDVCRGIRPENFVPDGMHQMSLAQAYAAVNKERVVSPSDILSHLDRRSLGQLVGLALDEVVEGESRVEIVRKSFLDTRRFPDR